MGGIDDAVSVSSVLAAGRHAAEARMTSRALVKHESPDRTVPDPDGFQIPAWDVVYADLPFRLDSGSSSDGGSTGVTIGGVTFEDATGVGHFPHPSPLLRDGDVLQIVSGEWAGDFYTVVAAIRYDQQTARRLPVREAKKPKGWDG